MQSWGGRSQFNRRDTVGEPTKSGLIGLLAAAQGRRRQDSIEDLLGLTFGHRPSADPLGSANSRGTPLPPAQDVADQHDPPVRHRLLTAPWWMLSLGAGVLLGLAISLFLMFVVPLVYGPATGSGTTFRLVVGIVFVAGGIVVGLLLGPVLARENQRACVTLGDLPAERQREAVRAVSRGPVPADPEVRSAAARLAGFHLAQTLRNRKAAVVIFPLNIMAQVLLANRAGFAGTRAPGQAD